MINVLQAPRRERLNQRAAFKCLVSCRHPLALAHKQPMSHSFKTSIFRLIPLSKYQLVIQKIIFVFFQHTMKSCFSMIEIKAWCHIVPHRARQGNKSGCNINTKHLVQVCPVCEWSRIDHPPSASFHVLHGVCGSARATTEVPDPLGASMNEKLASRLLTRNRVSPGVATSIWTIVSDFGHLIVIHRINHVSRWALTLS